MTEAPFRFNREPEPGADSPRLRDFVGFFRRSWWIVAGVALGLGLSTSVGVALLMRPVYEASTTLVVSPPTFSSDLKPSTLTVQGYRTLLESDAVISETKRRLVAADELEPEWALHLGHNLESRIFVSRRSEATALAPMIEARARHSSPDTAEKIATTWGQVFLERIQDLTSRTTMMTVRFIDDQYGEARTSLEELEQDALDTATDFQERIDRATIEWERRLVSFRNESEDLGADYQTETRVQMEDLAREWGLEVDSPPATGEPLGGFARSAETNRQLLQLVALRMQLAQTPQFVVLEKSISDDALWQAMALSPDRLAELENQNLLTEELSPIYTELSLRLSRIETDLGNIEAEGRDRLRRFTSALEMLQRQRSAGLAKLKAQRAVELDALKREKGREIESLKRLRDTELDRLNRKIGYSREFFDELASKQKQADLAKSQGTIRDVHLASPAVRPLQPEPRGILLKGLIAGVLGALLGLGAALFREFSPA